MAGRGRLCHHLILAGGHSAHHVVHNIRSVVIFAISACLGRSRRLHTQRYNRHSPAASGFLRFTQVLTPQHPLHLELGAPAAVFGYHHGSYTRNPGTVTRAKRGHCMWPDGDDAHFSRQWILLVVVTAWRLRSLSLMDRKLCDLNDISYFPFI
jgi:hypothetical protein